MNLSDAGNDRSNEAGTERRAERESLIDRWRAVSEAATSDYIYAYLMRVHNAEPRAMTRRLRLLAGTGRHGRKLPWPFGRRAFYDVLRPKMQR